MTDKIDFGPRISMEKANGNKIRERQGKPTPVSFEKANGAKIRAREGDPSKITFEKADKII